MSQYYNKHCPPPEQELDFIGVTSHMIFPVLTVYSFFSQGQTSELNAFSPMLCFRLHENVTEQKGAVSYGFL